MTVCRTSDMVCVVHGRWIDYPECLGYDGAYSDDHIVCSNCKSVWSIIDNDTDRFDYCPNCGAKMDGGEYTSEVDMIGESYSPFCKYCGGVDTMTPGKSMIFCGIDDEWHNVTAGECFGKCEKQAVIDGTEPARWIEPKEVE